MMGKLWVVLYVALAGAQVALGLPLRQPPPVYPHDASSSPLYLDVGSNMVYALVALGVTLTAAGLLFGCSWCFGWRKNQKLFSTSSSTLQTVQPERRAAQLAEPANNNVSEDNNNGPISLREMQNIANNNATVYITSENEERNRFSRESVVEFEPLPREIGVVDPLERCADWFGGEDLPRSRLQYLREIGRGWFGRVVEGEIEDSGSTSTVAVKILNQNASLEDKARFLDENRLYKDVRHENVLRLVAKYLQEDPWLLMFEFCSMDLSQWLESNRLKMAIHNESGVPLQLMCDVAGAISYLHSRGYLCGNVSSTNVLVRSQEDSVRAVVGSYTTNAGSRDYAAPETRRHPAEYTASSEVWSVGSLLWEVCSWGAAMEHHPPPPPALPFPYSAHLYQVMQLCWEPNPESRPSSAQVHALVSHLHAHLRCETARDEDDFEARWQRLKPNSIPKLDEHVAIVHAPSTSHASPLPGDSLSVELGLSRSSSVISDHLSTQLKSDSLNNLHGSLEDVRNIYLTHNETAAIECHQGNIALDDREDQSDSSVDPWLKDIIAGSQDDVSYYKDVSDVIKNLDNILNSEKTSSSESSHQASPSRDNLSLDCKKEPPVQSSLVKSPGISNFQNILEAGLNEDVQCDDDDRDTVGTLSHSFERRSDTTSQHTLENLTPDTPVRDSDFEIIGSLNKHSEDEVNGIVKESPEITDTNIPKDEKRSAKLPNLRELTVTSLTSVSGIEQLNVRETAPCDINSDDIVRTEVITKSIDKLNQNQVDIESDKDINSTDVSKIVQSETENNEIKEQKVDMKKTELSVTVAEIANDFIDNEVIQPAIETVYRMQNKPNHIHNEIKITTLVGSIATAHVQKEINETRHDLIPFQLTVAKETIEKLKPTQDNFEGTAIVTVDVNAFEALKATEPSTDKEKLEENLQTFLEEFKTSPIETPEPVQSISDDITEVTNETEKLETASVSEDTLLQTEGTDNLQSTEPETYPIGDMVENSKEVTLNVTTKSDESTIYMDLINDTKTEIKDKAIDNFKGVLEQSTMHNDTWMNDSTVYLDLPSILKDTNDFLHSERVMSNIEEDIITASTPKGSDEGSKETCDNLSETKSPERKSTRTLEQKTVPETPSPFESPTKSHPTDTYEDNSSVLGPFETSTEHKSLKDVDIPKEEILAFSSNFSEINLATPSPLRDANFLIEVPDIITFDNERVESHPESENSSEQSGTTKFISPSTPPNSPGIFQASTSHKYVVDIDIEPSGSGLYPQESDSGLSSWPEYDINHIEMQIHSKLAMAENENNMNIEYSGPLTVEGIVSEDEVILRDNDAVPEAVLAGNGGSVEDLRGFALDEECVKALRNELELKLPLAQVSSIEPSYEPESEWSELPPPPELIVCYAGGALSPIAEETGHQLHAYENDAFNTSTRTDSSESYLEPCNNSTDEVTDLPTATQPSANHSTYTVHSANETYNVHKDGISSKEVTMSPDSLNCSPYRKPTQNQTQSLSPIDDQTYKNDERESCEHISQVSPFLLTPTTDSTPGGSPTDNATAVSTLSKTSVTTDAKPREDLSKATSIDSWCSNDTLYNVEENFDDLAIEADAPNDKDNSEGTDTLTHNEEKDPSHCLTYIINDSDSECDTFSPDSITEKDNYTYTKIKTDPSNTQSVVNETNDTTNTQVIDVAYGTLPSYSNCTTEVMSTLNDPWMIAQPEMIRRSPMVDIDFNDTQPCIIENDEPTNKTGSPNITQPCVKKMDSVEIPCLPDDFAIDQDKSQQQTVKNNALESHPRIIEDNEHNIETGSPTVQACANNIGSVEIPCFRDDIAIDQDESPKEPVSNNAFDSQPRIDDQKTETGSSTTTQPCVKTMDSVEIPCLRDDFSIDQYELPQEPVNNNAFRCDYRNMTPSVTSTPIVDSIPDDVHEEVIPINLPNAIDSPLYALNNIPNFHAFIQSAEIRPQDISSNSNEISTNIGTGTDTGLLLEGESITLSKNSNRDSITVSSTPNYSDFEGSAIFRPQDTNSGGSSQNFESGASSGDFRQFENSVRNRPQDLSSVMDASSMFLNSERRSSEIAMTSHSHKEPPLDISPPDNTNLVESQPLVFNNETLAVFETDAEETDQPHSIIITDVSTDIPFSPKSPVIDTNADSFGEVNKTYDSHTKGKLQDGNETFNSHLGNTSRHENGEPNHETQNFNGIEPEVMHENVIDDIGTTEECIEAINTDVQTLRENHHNANPTVLSESLVNVTTNMPKINGTTENYATVSFLNETFEEFVDNNLSKERNEAKSQERPVTPSPESIKDNAQSKTPNKATDNMNGNHDERKINGTMDNEVKMTKDFLQNEKRFSQLDPYLPLLNDIRFSGPTSDLMSTSFTIDSPTEPASPECEQDNKPDPVADLVKEWDSDTDSQDTNSSSGEFIWKDGDGFETAVVPTECFDHQRSTNDRRETDNPGGSAGGSGDSGSGSEGDEVEFVPSSWDCRAEPSKSSLRTLQCTPESKKRVVFKRQKYHCVYEYPREVAEVDVHSPAFAPDYSTYCEWDGSSAAEAELGYGQLFGAPSPLDMYPLRGGVFGADYDDDFFISSSARPFEALGVMSTTSQFFPGMHSKAYTPHLPDDIDELPPPSPLPVTQITTRTPSLDFTTPDSGVEDITPGSTEDFKTKLLEEPSWKPVDSTSSSESVSPSSPGGEALGGLRHTRDKLKLDLPPSPHIPSPRHNRVFNFILDKPKRQKDRDVTPLVMTDETPVVTSNLPLDKDEDVPVSTEPTFSTFGKNNHSNEDGDNKIVLDEIEEDKKDESPVKETVKGEGTVLDSGDEDSGIESSSKASLERKSNVS